MSEDTQYPVTGNAAIDSIDTRGWFVGDFLPESAGIRKDDQVEIKWGAQAAGEKRAEWVTGETRTTVGILVSGKFKMQFRDREVILSKQGDYVMWGPGTDHTWEVLEDCVLITVRWYPANKPVN